MKKWLWAVAAIVGVVTFIHHQQASAGEAAAAQATIHRTRVAETSSSTRTKPLEQFNPLATEAQTVIKAFAATKAVNPSSVVHSYTSLPGQVYDKSTLISAGRGMMQALHVAKTAVLTRTSKGETFVEMSGVEIGSGSGVSEGEVNLYLSSFLAPGVKMTSVVARVTRQLSDAASLATDMTELAAALQAEHVQPQVSAYLKGTLDTSLTTSQVAATLDGAMKAAKAQKVEGITSPDVTSWSAYTPDDRYFIQTGRHKMNLQLAIHNNSDGQTANVLVGSPIIVDAY